MIFLLILILPYSLGISRSNQRYLDAPKLLSVSPTEPAGLFIKWDTVEQSDSDPVIGFKIKLWTVEQETEIRYELINADEYPGYVHDLKPSKIQPFSINETLTFPSRNIIVNGGDETNYHIENLEYNVIYEVRVLAFKIDQEGPMSEPMRIKMVRGTGNGGVLQRLPTGCSFLIRTQVLYHDDIYPHEYISYL